MAGKNHQSGAPLLGPWMGLGALLGMVAGATFAFLFGRPYDQSLTTGVLIGVPLGALLGNLRRWQKWGEERESAKGPTDE